jgi:predicted signal transduction protein with EAL and GGDEF domain
MDFLALVFMLAGFGDAAYGNALYAIYFTLVAVVCLLTLLFLNRGR